MSAIQQPEKKENKSNEVAPRFKIEPEKMLFSWNAPSRPFKTRDREFWVGVGAIAVVAGFILYIVEGVMPVILMVALIFLFYILSTVKPDEIKYGLTNKGIKIADKLTPIDLLTRFWFGSRFGSNLLVFEMISLPGRLELVINSKDKDAIRKALKDYLVEEEVPPSQLERAATFFSKKIPGNK